MQLLIFLFLIRLVTLFAFMKVLFILVNLEYTKRIYGKAIQKYLKIFFICLITYKFFDITFGFMEQVELLNSK
jgi:hypothetical protein